MIWSRCWLTTYYKSLQKFALSTKVNAMATVYRRSTRGSLGVRRLPLLGAEEAPQEHSPRHKLGFESVACDLKYKQWGSFISGVKNLEIAGKKLFVMPFSTWQSQKVEKNCWNVPLLGFPDSSPCSLCDLALLIWGKKKQVLLSAPLFMYDTGVPQRACVIQKKKRHKNAKKTHQGSSRSFAVNEQSRGKHQTSNW